MQFDIAFHVAGNPLHKGLTVIGMIIGGYIGADEIIVGVLAISKSNAGTVKASPGTVIERSAGLSRQSQNIAPLFLKFLANT